MRGVLTILTFVVYLIFGLYLLNYPFGIIALPEGLSNLDPWIVFIGGLLIIFGGINHFRANRLRYRY